MSCPIIKTRPVPSERYPNIYSAAISNNSYIFLARSDILGLFKNLQVYRTTDGHTKDYSPTPGLNFTIWHISALAANTHSLFVLDTLQKAVLKLRAQEIWQHGLVVYGKISCPACVAITVDKKGATIYASEEVQDHLETHSYITTITSNGDSLRIKTNFTHPALAYDSLRDILWATHPSSGVLYQYRPPGTLLGVIRLSGYPLSGLTIDEGTGFAFTCSYTLGLLHRCYVTDGEYYQSISTAPDVVSAPAGIVNRAKSFYVATKSSQVFAQFRYCASNPCFTSTQCPLLSPCVQGVCCKRCKYCERCNLNGTCELVPGCPFSTSESADAALIFEGYTPDHVLSPMKAEHQNKSIRVHFPEIDEVNRGNGTVASVPFSQGIISFDTKYTQYGEDFTLTSVYSQYIVVWKFQLYNVTAPLTFASSVFDILRNTDKWTIYIANWPFRSNLHHLVVKVRLKSKDGPFINHTIQHFPNTNVTRIVLYTNNTKVTLDLANHAVSGDRLLPADISVDVPPRSHFHNNNNNNSSNNNNNNYTGAMLYLRFPYFESGDNITTGLLYDPNLSILVAEDSGTSLETGDGSEQTKLIVEIVVPVVSVFCLCVCGCGLIALVVLIRRKYVEHTRVNMVYFNLNDEDDKSDSDEETSSAL